MNIARRKDHETRQRPIDLCEVEIATQASGQDSQWVPKSSGTKDAKRKIRAIKNVDVYTRGDIIGAMTKRELGTETSFE
jgi:hypothetical protein